LCATCSHSTEGEGHVTREVLTQQIEKRKLERLAKVNSRSSPVQRRDPVSGLPVNLFELLKGDWKEEGFHLAKVYALELDHSLMAYLPALVVEEDQIIYTTDKELLRQIWNLLPPRKSKMRSGTGYVNPKKRVVYFDKDTRHQQEESTPAGLLDQELFRELCKRDTPFGWARGLIGSDDLSSEQFQVMIEKALRHLE
jgi:hypothetical protein